LHDPDSRLGPPKTKVSLSNNFEPSYLARPDLHDDMPLASLEQKSHLPMFLPYDLALEASSPRDITKDVLIFINPSTPLVTFLSLRRVINLRMLVS